MASFGKKTRSPGYRPGDNWVACEVCGLNVLSSGAKRRWDGVIVCPEDWEARHPQDFVRARKDRQRPNLARPEPTDVVAANRICSSRTAKTGVATATCAISGVDEFVSSSIPNSTFNENTL